MYEALREGRFVLIVQPLIQGGHVPQTRWLRVAAPAGPLHRTLLIRPDGHIAWASDTGDPRRLRVALEHWSVGVEAGLREADNTKVRP